MLFLQKRPLVVKFSKLCSKGFHSDTDQHVVFKFREIWLMGNHFWWSYNQMCEHRQNAV